MKNTLLLFIITSLLFNCSNDRELTLGDFIDVDNIDRVEMINNSGVFILTNKQLNKFREQISTLTYEPDISVKVGAIHMTLTIEGKEYGIATATHGDLVEIDSRLVTKLKSKFENPYFKTNGINFDNYLPKQ